MDTVSPTTSVLDQPLALPWALTRRKLIAIGAGLIVLVGLAVGTPRVLYLVGHETTDDAYVDAQTIVVTARVSGTIATILVNEGQVVKRGDALMQMDDTDLRAAMVRAKDAVATARANLRQARDDYAATRDLQAANTLRSKASLGAAQAQSQEMQVATVGAREDAQAAQDAIADQQAALIAARADIPSALQHLQNVDHVYSRYQTLARKGYVSMQALEAAYDEKATAEALYRNALSATRRAEADLVVARDKYASASAQARAAGDAADIAAYGPQNAAGDILANSPSLLAEKADAVEVASAQLAAAMQSYVSAQHDLDQTTLRAPADGRVGLKAASVGQTLQAGDPGVIVMPLHDIYVTANFKETQLANIVPGANADVHIDNYPGLTFHGKVLFIGAGSQSTLSLIPNTEVGGNFVKVAQRVPVRIGIDPGQVPIDRALRNGVSAEVSVVKP